MVEDVVGGGVVDKLIFKFPCCWLSSGGGATMGIAWLTRFGGGYCCGYCCDW